MLLRSPLCKSFVMKQFTVLNGKQEALGAAADGTTLQSNWVSSCVVYIGKIE